MTLPNLVYMYDDLGPIRSATSTAEMQSVIFPRAPLQHSRFSAERGAGRRRLTFSAAARLMLQQTAARADAHGVFSGNCPSGGGISDYALIWFEALRVYLAATGDAPACKALWPACAKCMDYFLSPACYTAKGFKASGLGVVVGFDMAVESFVPDCGYLYR